MMQAEGSSQSLNNNGEPDSYERKSFLPQQQQHHTESLRSRRRHDAVSQTFTFNSDSSNYTSEERRYDNNSNDNGSRSRGINYPQQHHAASRTILSTDNNSKNGNYGRPNTNKIKSIARIGRSTSLSVAGGEGGGDESYDGSTHYSNNNNSNNVEECNKNSKSSPYYFDDTNDFSWECSFGTTEGDGIWMVKNDPPGSIMSILVWILIVYSGITIALLAENGHLSHALAYLYCTICALALASHAKTSFSDPGAIPSCRWFF
mmetsp:Transcript_31975/g.59126  ORF Transcript_31975/g.59126 Transcript_31975/m.59126 type:complete len:261 (+) Transcript_31975:23-805(+)